jgi:hypothetical protein
VQRVRFAFLPSKHLLLAQLDRCAQQASGSVFTLPLAVAPSSLARALCWSGSIMEPSIFPLRRDRMYWRPTTDMQHTAEPHAPTVLDLASLDSELANAERGTLAPKADRLLRTRGDIAGATAAVGRRDWESELLEPQTEPQPDADALEAMADAAELDEEPPPTLRSAQLELLPRVQRAEMMEQVPLEVRDVLRAAAVIGTRFQVAAVARLLATSELAVLLALQHARDLGLELQDGGDGSFVLGNDLLNQARSSLLPSLERHWGSEQAPRLQPANRNDSGGEEPSTGRSGVRRAALCDEAPYASCELLSDGDVVSVADRLACRA